MEFYLQARTGCGRYVKCYWRGRRSMTPTPRKWPCWSFMELVINFTHAQIPTKSKKWVVLKFSTILVVLGLQLIYYYYLFIIKKSLCIWCKHAITNCKVLKEYIKELNCISCTMRRQNVYDKANPQYSQSNWSKCSTSTVVVIQIYF